MYRFMLNTRISQSLFQATAASDFPRFRRSLETDNFSVTGSGAAARARTLPETVRAHYHPGSSETCAGRLRAMVRAEF